MGNLCTVDFAVFVIPSNSADMGVLTLAISSVHVFTSVPIGESPHFGASLAYAFAMLLNKPVDSVRDVSN